MFAISIGVIAVLLGFLELQLGQPTLPLLFTPVAYLALLLLLGQESKKHRDPLTALNIIVFVAFLRFGLPWLLLPVTHDDKSLLSAAMHLHPRDWQQGHTLALTAMLALTLGWVLVARRDAGGRPVIKPFPTGIGLVAAGAMVVGMAALFLFVGSNGSIGDAVADGSFRGTTVQVGTGPFLYLSFLLVSGSVVLCAQLLSRPATPRWLAVAPVVVAGLCYMILGGRGKMITPLLAAVLLLWTARSARQRLNRTPIGQVVKVAVLILPILLWLTYLGRLYRGGEGLNAFPKSFSASGITEYVQEQAMSDVGSLHALAKATALPAGVLHGKTFTAFLWPLNEKLGIPGKSAGVYITEQSFAPGERKWGFNASMAGDAYLNFGAVGVLLVPFLAGAALKLLYVRCRQGRLHVPLYACGAVYGMWMFNGTVQVWPVTLVVLTSAAIMIRVSSIKDSASVTHSTPLPRLPRPTQDRPTVEEPEQPAAPPSPLVWVAPTGTAGDSEADDLRS